MKTARNLQAIRDFRGNRPTLDRKIYKERFALTVLCTVFVFLILFVTVIGGSFVIYILTRQGVLEGFGLPHEISGFIVFFTTLSSSVIGLIIAAIASKYITRPINHVINQINRLADGDFKARIHYKKPLSGHSTFAKLSDSFNTMAQELENTEILRSDFINNFSHEFKTPIVSIAGFAQLLRESDMSREEQDKYLAIIEEESLRLAAMATNVLQMSKVENMTILTDSSRYNLSEQLRSSILLLEPKWENKNIEFNIEFGEHEVYANEELMKQVWINLIDNAIKFSPQGGMIEIVVDNEENGIHISVMNQGEAIPEDKREKIFTKFYQADESHASEGNGIGLALVSKVVELHGGRVIVSCKDGVTAFTVSLPK